MLNLNKFMYPLLIKNAVQRLCTESPPNMDELKNIANFKSKFSNDQIKFVLKKMKNFSAVELQKYGIDEENFKQLQSIKYKDKNKQINLVDEIMYANVMDIVDLASLCENILNTNKLNTKAIIKGSIGSGNFKDIKTAIGIRTGISSVTYTHLDISNSNCNILKLYCYSKIIEDSNEIPDVIKKSMDLVRNLPVVDAYVMEKQPQKLVTKKLNYSTMNSMLLREQLLAGVIAGLLSNIDTQDSSKSSQLYFLRQYTTANYFKLVLGKEVVSAENTIQAILTKKYASNHLSVSVSEEILDFYHSVNLYQKEEINVTLLMTIMFLENVYMSTNKKQKKQVVAAENI